MPGEPEKDEITPSKPHKRIRRGPGRPETMDDSVDLREQLLEATLTCYVRKGIAATTLREIATEAGVTPALLHYYFGDKTKLRQTVIEEKFFPLIDELHHSVLRAGDDIAMTIGRFVNGISALLSRHRWLPALWVREILCEGGDLRELLVARVGPLVPQAMAQRFSEAQQRGELNPALNPRLIVVSLVGLTMFPLASAPVWRAMLKLDETDTDALVRHTAELLNRGLELKHDIAK